MEKKVLRKLARAGENKAVEMEQNLMERIIEAVKGLRYGTVTITVQDSVAIQIERTEKIRLK